MPHIARVIDNLPEMGGLLTRPQLSPLEPLPISWLCECHDSDSSDAWTATNATATIDTSDYWYGAESIQVVVASGGTGSIANTLPFTVNVRAFMGVMLKVSDLTKLETCYLYISEDDGTNGYRFPLYNRVSSPVNAFNLVANEWGCCWLKRINATSIGSPTAWGTTDGNAEYPVAHVKLECIATSGQTSTVKFNGVMVERFSKMCVLWDFDDGMDSVVDNALPILRDEYGWFGNCAVIGSQVGSLTPDPDQGTYATATQLDTLYDAGWDLLNHGYTSNGGGTAAAFRADVLQGRRYIDNQGWVRGSRFYIAPGLNANPTGNNAVAAFQGFVDAARGRCHRTSAEPAYSADHTYRGWMPYDIYNIPYRSCYHSTLAAVTTLLTVANRDRGRVNLYTHDVRDDCSAYGLSPADLRSVCDTIKTYEDAGTAEVLTWSQWWDRTFGARQLVVKSRTSI